MKALKLKNEYKCIRKMDGYVFACLKVISFSVSYRFICTASEVSCKANILRTFGHKMIYTV